MIILPFQPSTPFYDFSTDIDKQSVTFDVHWNARDTAWYFDVYDDVGRPIVSGVKVVRGVYLGRRARRSIFATGALFAVDVSGQKRDAGFDDLGARVQVIYASDFELASLVQAINERKARGL